MLNKGARWSTASLEQASLFQSAPAPAGVRRVTKVLSFLFSRDSHLNAMCIMKNIPSGSEGNDAHQLPPSITLIRRGASLAKQKPKRRSNKYYC